MAMIQKQIKELRDLADDPELDMKCSIVCDGICNEALRNAADTIERLSAYLTDRIFVNDGWIPVKWHHVTEEERKEEQYFGEYTICFDCPMPEDEQDILVTVETSDGIRFTEKEVFRYADEGCCPNSCFEWETEVIAWMPLPAPYKGDE